MTQQITEFGGDFVLEMSSVRGTRAFLVDDEGYLTGVYFHQRWLPGVNEAKCLRTKSAECDHPQVVAWGWTCDCREIPDPCGPPPGPTCRCGFYGYYEGSNDYADPSTVAAVVEGTGRTEVGTRGFKAAKARILAIYLPPAGARTWSDSVEVPATPWETGAQDRPAFWWSLGGFYAAVASWCAYRAVTANAWSWGTVAVDAVFAAWAAWNVRDIRRARAAHAGTSPRPSQVVQLSRRETRAYAHRAHIAVNMQRHLRGVYFGLHGHAPVTPEQHAQVAANYPDIPIYDDLDRMLADFPPNPPEPELEQQPTKEA